MIFVTVGTEKFAFDRLLGALHSALEQGLIKEDVVAQTGHSRVSYPLFRSKGFFAFDEQARLIQEADIVVAHAGEGSLLVSLNSGKVPILFPRRAAFGEHVDDHQWELAGRLEKTGRVLVAYSAEELVEKVLHYKELCAGMIPGARAETKRELLEYLASICSCAKDTKDARSRNSRSGRSSS